MTGAQSRTIARLRKRHHDLEWSTTNGVRVRYTERGDDKVTEKIVLESGLLEDVPIVVNLDYPDKRDVIRDCIDANPHSPVTADAILNALHVAGWKVVRK